MEREVFRARETRNRRDRCRAFRVRYYNKWSTCSQCECGAITSNCFTFFFLFAFLLSVLSLLFYRRYKIHSRNLRNILNLCKMPTYFYAFIMEIFNETNEEKKKENYVQSNFSYDQTDCGFNEKKS